MTPRPFAIGLHVWSVFSGGFWVCRCGQVLREWVDYGGRVHFNFDAEASASPGLAGACQYRPSRHMVATRDPATGVVASLDWLGDF